MVLIKHTSVPCTRQLYAWVCSPFHLSNCSKKRLLCPVVSYGFISCLILLLFLRQCLAACVNTLTLFDNNCYILALCCELYVQRPGPHCFSYSFRLIYCNWDMMWMHYGAAREHPCSTITACNEAAQGFETNAPPSHWFRVIHVRADAFRWFSLKWMCACGVLAAAGKLPDD